VGPDVVSTTPSDGATDVYVGSPILIEFDGPAPGAVLTVSDDAAAAVGGNSLAVAEHIYGFRTTGSLSAASTFTATATWGEDTRTHSWSFTTAAAAPTALSPDGLTFRWDLADPNANYISPPNGGTVLSGLGSTTFLTQVTHPAGTTDLYFLGAREDDSNPDTQDLSQDTFDLTENGPAPYIDPYFVAGPTDVTQEVPVGFFNLDVTLRDTTFSGNFSTSTGTEIDAVGDGVFFGYIDARDLSVPVDCADLGGLVDVELPCAPCPLDPTEIECIIIWGENLGAYVVPGLDLVEVPGR
jgi:hypothetical protein